MSKKSSESIVSYILSMQERSAGMSELARENLAKAQKQQKCWYDENAREHQFKPGEQVHTSKLLGHAVAWTLPSTTTTEPGEL